MGKASRQKRERRGEVAAAAPGPHRGEVMVPAPPSLMLPTGEPFQPVRLCYTIEKYAAARAALDALGCIREDRQDDDVLHWYSDHEAAKLPIGGIPASRPARLGSIRFPDPFDFQGMLAIDTGSIERALAAARFFASRLPQECQLTRCRVVNLFCPTESAAARGRTEQLLAVLDMEGFMDSDPRREDARMHRDLERARGLEEAGRILAARLQSILRQANFPALEDFAVFPAEAEPPFDGLEVTLGLRRIRALKVCGGATEAQLAAEITALAGGTAARP